MDNPEGPTVYHGEISEYHVITYMGMEFEKE